MNRPGRHIRHFGKGWLIERVADMKNAKLYISLRDIGDTSQQIENYGEAAGLVVPPEKIEPHQIEGSPSVILETLDPGAYPQWREGVQGIWSSDAPLDSIAKTRDEWPELNFLPRLNVYQPEVGYHFNPTSLGEGFKFYTPDTATIQTYRTIQDDYTLEDQIQRTVKLGFDALWLHATHAEVSGKGLDLDLLERASRLFDGDLWISGGATEERHLKNLSKQGGFAAVVIGEALVFDCGCEPLLTALEPEGPTGVTVSFETRPDQASAEIM